MANPIVKQISTPYDIRSSGAKTLVIEFNATQNGTYTIYLDGLTLIFTVSGNLLVCQCSGQDEGLILCRPIIVLHSGGAIIDNIEYDGLLSIHFSSGFTSTYLALELSLLNLQLL